MMMMMEGLEVKGKGQQKQTNQCRRFLKTIVNMYTCDLQNRNEVAFFCLLYQKKYKKVYFILKAEFSDIGTLFYINDQPC